MDIFIILLVVIIAIFAGLLYYRSRKRNRLYEEYKITLSKFEKTNNSLMKELERTSKIAKNGEGKDLLEGWSSEYSVLKIKFLEIFNLFETLNDNNTFANHSNFISIIDDLDSKVYDFENDFFDLYNKIKHYTGYELENTQISLNLKTRIKELVKEFDLKLKYLEIYNSNFNQNIADAQVFIDKFETLQKDGEYPEGRTILKNCHEKVTVIEGTFNSIIKFMDFIDGVDSDLNLINQIDEEIKNIGYKINIESLEEETLFFNETKDVILNKVAKFNFDEKIDSAEATILQEECNTLDNKLSELKIIVEDRFTFIKNIMRLEEENKNLMDTVSELIVGAKEERDQIIKLYELNEIRQVSKIDSEIETFEIFKEDYNKLIEIIHEAKEDYINLEQRIIQSNKYLIRLITNFEEALVALRAVRRDELNTRDKIDSYAQKIIEIDLYIKKNSHSHRLTRTIVSKIEELTLKFDELQKEIDKEPLNITNVRNLSESVETLIETLIDNEIENNIKHRVGSELLLNYISRFNKNERMDNTITRLFNLYNDNEYTVLLKEAYALIEDSSPQGKDIYVQIVNKVEIEPFNSILK